MESTTRAATASIGAAGIDVAFGVDVGIGAATGTGTGGVATGVAITSDGSTGGVTMSGTGSATTIAGVAEVTGVTGADAGMDAAAMVVPHLAQNFADALLPCAQLGQAIVSGAEVTDVDAVDDDTDAAETVGAGEENDVPQDRQNLAESLFSAPQCKHSILLSPCFY